MVAAMQELLIKG